MLSYMEQLIKASTECNVSILKAFRMANVPTSTYYRTIAGGDLRLSTAKKVLNAIRLHALQRTESN
jgi:predicted transcriptional regulator